MSSGYSLEQVRIYRGIPSNRLDPKGYGAVRRQTAVWNSSSLNEVILRPIKYPRGWPNSNQEDGLPREKGIDVALAVDFVTMGLTSKFDAGVIFSMDSDLKPPLEYLALNEPHLDIGVVSWQNSGSTTAKFSKISFPSQGIKDLRMDLKDYDSVKDLTNYSK
jgi:hypothetical protein